MPKLRRTYRPDRQLNLLSAPFRDAFAQLLVTFADSGESGTQGGDARGHALLRLFAYLPVLAHDVGTGNMIRYRRDELCHRSQRTLY